MTCPKCGGALTADPNFVQWCPGCNWNLEPLAPKKVGRMQRLQQRASRRLSERLFADVEKNGIERRPLLRATVFVAAGFVHLITAALLVSAILIFTSNATFWVRYAGAFICFMVFLAVQPFGMPNLRNLRSRPPVGLTRENAPQLFTLLDELAKHIGTQAPDNLVLDTRYNASIRHRPRRTTITIGMALWSVIDWPMRLALLGHELAHRVAGDARRSWWTWAALHSLRTWAYLLRPTSSRMRRGFTGQAFNAGTGGGLASIGELLLPIILIPLTILVAIAAAILQYASSWQGQRSEYRADLIAAKATGTEPTVALLRNLELSTAVVGERDREIGLRNNANPWPQLHDYAANIPDTEWLRLERIASAGLKRIDDTHPPDEHRRQFILSNPQSSGQVRVDADRGRTIDAEIAPSVARLNKRIADGYY